MPVIDRVMSIENQYLQRCYSLEDLSGDALERSINREDGTVDGATQDGDKTPYGAPCYTFDGNNDYIDCDTNISDLDNWNSGGIIALANTNTVTGGIDDVFHIRSNTGQNEVELRIIDDDFQVIVIVNGASEETYQTSVISANTWFTMAVTWQDASGDGDIFYYKDGSQVDTDSTANTMNTESWTEATIGSARTGGTQFWSGSIGPVLCWHGVRPSAAEIALADRFLRAL